MKKYVKNSTIKKFTDIKLSKEEKALAKQNLVNFMAKNPARLNNRLSEGGYFASFRSAFQNFFIKPLGAVLSILIVGGVSTSLAAQGSMPGDMLYPVKLKFNEKIQEMVQFSNKGQAQVALTHAENRLKEAEKLAEQGKLNIDTKNELEANFEAKIKKTKDLVKKEHEEKDEASAKEIKDNLKKSLKTHQEVLTKLAEKDKEDKHSYEVINGLINKVKVEVDDDRDYNSEENKVEINEEKSGERVPPTIQPTAPLEIEKTTTETEKIEIRVPETQSSTSLFNLRQDLNLNLTTQTESERD